MQNYLNYIYLYSQNSAGNDDGWNGFESHNSNFGSGKSVETSDPPAAASSKSRSMKVPPKTIAEDDLLSLDVKATANKKSSGKAAKKPEDDIWEMLNN